MKTNRLHPGRSSRAGFQWGFVGLVLTVSVFLAWMGFRPGGWFVGEPVAAVAGAPVRRGPLRISVLERGNLKAADSVSLKSEIEGQTTILRLIPEGTHVKEGDFLVELDAAPLIERQIQQDISVRNARAAFVKSQQNYKIQQSQNDSDIAKADQELTFAADDLRKFLDTKQFESAKAQEAITLAEETHARDKNKLEWSVKLSENGFLTATELEADRLAANRAGILLEQARREMNLLEGFELPRQEAELNAALAESKREADRVRLQASARIVDYEADMLTNEAKVKLEEEKLERLNNQIAKSKIHAPRAGMVVYGQDMFGMRGNREPISEGTQVHERQEIITIPSAGGMIAQASLHESVLKQVSVGQQCVVKVDSLPGREFSGRVAFVALLPDQGSWWANPNLRLYRTDIQISEAIEGMRPGMSCAVEILVEEIPDAVYVPVQSVFRSGAQTLCYVAEPTGPVRRDVQIGRYNDKWVQILSGVSEGEEVLLSLPPGVTLEPPAEAARPEAPPGEAPGWDGAKPGGGAEGAPVIPAVEGSAKEGGGSERGTPSPQMMERMRNRRGGGREGGPGGARAAAEGAASDAKTPSSAPAAGKPDGTGASQGAKDG
jgi:HlyD family secretion protein